MKFLSPIFLRACEFHAIKIGLNRRATPLQVSVAFHGLVSFIPVKVSQYDGLRFDPAFRGNSVPLLDIVSLRKGQYPFIFNENGTLNEEASSGPRVQVTTDVDTHRATLEVPLGLENGDIILASSRFPARDLY